MSMPTRSALGAFYRSAQGARCSLELSTWWLNLVYGNGVFVAGGQNSHASGPTLAISSNGEQWNYSGTGVTSSRKIAYGNGVWVKAVPTDDLSYVSVHISEDDGESWEDVNHLISNISKVLFMGG